MKIYFGDNDLEKVEHCVETREWVQMFSKSTIKTAEGHKQSFEDVL